jgi:hypothetical protein
MQTLRLRQDVSLIFIVTDAFKARLLQEFTEAADEVKGQIEQFDFRARHALAELQRADLTRAMAARQQIEGEKRRLETVHREFLDRKADLESLELGTEYPSGTIEGVVEVSVGEQLFEKLAGVQVVVKDGTVIEIRTREFRPEDVIIPQSQIHQSGQ